MLLLLWYARNAFGGRRLRTQGGARVGASVAAGAFLPYGELARACRWGRSVRRVPLAHIRSAQTELLARRSCSSPRGTMLCRDLDNISFNTAEGSRNVGHVSTPRPAPAAPGASGADKRREASHRGGGGKNI